MRCELVAEVERGPAGAWLRLVVRDGAQVLGVRSIEMPAPDNRPASHIAGDLAVWVQEKALSAGADFVAVVAPVPVYMVGAHTVAQKLGRILREFDGVVL